MENKRSHLAMIQGVVNRLSQNSSLLKGWSVVLIAAMFALSAKDTQIMFIYLAYFPCVVFWGLDGYYLRQEKLFRKLYNHVRKLNETDIDFSMDNSAFKNEVQDWLSVALRDTLLAFHGVVLFTIVVVMVISLCFK